MNCLTLVVVDVLQMMIITNNRMKGVDMMLIQGDVLEDRNWGNIPDNCIQACITSPPYFQQRDYGFSKQIGLECTVGEYVKKLLVVFKKLYPKLKDDGILFVNLADTYYGGNKGTGFSDPKRTTNNKDGLYASVKKSREILKNNFKNKSLMAIPQIFTVSMLNQGWILRNQIIWQKPNAIPDSANDRFTQSYEVVLFFTKSSKYKYNTSYEFAVTDDRSAPRGSEYVLGNKNSGRRTADEIINTPLKMRKRRDIITISTENTKKNHMATFPEELAELLIECSTDDDDMVFDPFFGSGTTLAVAKRLGRKWSGIEYDTAQVNFAEERIRKTIIQTKLF